MPLDDGCWFDQHHGVEDLRPNSVKPYQEESVGGEKPKLTRASPIQSAICRRIMRWSSNWLPRARILPIATDIPGPPKSADPRLQPMGQMVDTYRDGDALRVRASRSSRGRHAPPHQGGLQ